MSETVYFFNHLQKLIKRKNTRSIIEDSQEKEITSDKSDLMKDTLQVTTTYDKEIEVASFMAVRENESSFSLYRITKISDPAETLEFTGIGFAPNELDAYIIKDIRPSGEPIKNVLERLISFTEGNWRVGHVDAMLPAVTATFYYISVKEALKQLQTLGMEILFRCSLDADGIKDKWIEVYEQIGEESNTRFVYGSKALTVVREIDRSSISTSMIGRGRGEEVGDGYGRRIEFTDIEWKKNKGDPLDKPKGQNWLEDPDATQKHGIPQKDGSMRKRETVVVFDDIEDPEELLKNTYATLVESARPLVQFKAEVIGGDVIGNIVTIHRHDKDYHYKTRIYKTTLDRLTGKTTIELGDNLTKDARKQTASIINNINSLESSKMTFYESTEIGKYQDDIMRGAGDNGGSIYWVNGIEAGVSDSREIYETVYMDGPSIPESQLFMVQNNSGISFKQCLKGEWQTIQDVHDGDSTTAWTLDGKFNANFIQTGVIQADIFESSFSACGDQLKMKDGAIHAYDNSKKLVSQINKRGFEFYKSDGSTLGRMGTTSTAGNPFAGAVTPTSLDDNSIVITTAADGKYICISTGEGTGFMMLGNGKTYYFGDLDVQGTLRLNGLPIIAGQGGGPSGGGETPGGYPSELKTDAEKRAWRIYDILCNNGFTKQSACGILGNMQQETGGTFDPDTVQVDGPAYGLVQWDGSSYPLVGPATWDGKVYVQNLFTAAGIKEPITSLDAQVRLLIWTFTNGQWIGVVQPTTIDGFKACTDPRQAAHAFERNYERPAATHPERQDYAVNWYNKFKDLKPAGATGEAGLKHLESLIGQRIGNGQCYGLSAEYSGYLGGCGMGAGTQYGLTHVIGNTAAASDIGIAYDWAAVGWKVIQNPSYDQLVVGAIINWARGGQVGSWTADGNYGHTGVICGLENGRMQTYEQNTELGMICGKLDRQYYSASAISSIVIPPK